MSENNEINDVAQFQSFLEHYEAVFLDEDIFHPAALWLPARAIMRVLPRAWRSLYLEREQTDMIMPLLRANLTINCQILTAVDYKSFYSEILRSKKLEHLALENGFVKATQTMCRTLETSHELEGLYEALLETLPGVPPNDLTLRS